MGGGGDSGRRVGHEALGFLRDQVDQSNMGDSVRRESGGEEGQAYTSRINKQWSAVRVWEPREPRDVSEEAQLCVRPMRGGSDQRPELGSGTWRQCRVSAGPRGLMRTYLEDTLRETGHGERVWSGLGALEDL